MAWPACGRPEGGGGVKVYLPPLRRPRIEMVPLIDSFFLLLAFFMSSVLSMQVVKGLPVDLPRTSSAAAVDRKDRRIITIGREGQLQLDGEPVALEQLRGRLTQDPAQASLQVGIRADEATPYRSLMQVLAEVRRSGVAKVLLLSQ